MDAAVEIAVPRGLGALHVTPSSVDRAKKRVVPPHHVTTHTSPCAAMSGRRFSVFEVFSCDGTPHVDPLSIERVTRMVFPANHAHAQVPPLLVAIAGYRSGTLSVMGLGLSGIGGLHVTPSSVVLLATISLS